MIIVCQRLLKNTKISGITIFPFIFLKKEEYKNQPTLINHEKIHLKQQVELLILFFYLWYFIEFHVWLLKYKNVDKAYRRISFEREAYENEHNLRIWNTENGGVFGII